MLEFCIVCKSLMVGKRDKLQCSNKRCGKPREVPLPTYDRWGELEKDEDRYSNKYSGRQGAGRES